MFCSVQTEFFYPSDPVPSENPGIRIQMVTSDPDPKIKRIQNSPFAQPEAVVQGRDDEVPRAQPVQQEGAQERGGGQHSGIFMSGFFCGFPNGLYRMSQDFLNRQ